jgi:putative hydrolase of the HAD superfamily
MIKNIIFDMGNVLTIYNAREHIMKYVDNENDFYIISRFISEFRIEQPENLPMEELVKKLKDSEYKLYLFSNTAHRFHKFSKNIKSIEYMDGIWISCEHGYLKPEPDAFNSFFQKFQLKPSECFFIDDSPANIEASLRMGMKGCVYHKDVHELEEDLRLAGV